MQILLATTNPGKVVEMRPALADLWLELISLDQLPTVEPPPETGSTLAANAALKAAYYFSHFGIPTLADDSGLMVDALGGRPGVQTARFAATDSGRIKNFCRCWLILKRGDQHREVPISVVPSAFIPLDGNWKAVAELTEKSPRRREVTPDSVMTRSSTTRRWV